MGKKERRDEFKAREESIARKRVERKGGVREEKVMLVEGGCCEKDLRLVGRVLKTMGRNYGRNDQRISA